MSSPAPAPGPSPTGPQPSNLPAACWADDPFEFPNKLVEEYLDCPWKQWSAIGGFLFFLCCCLCCLRILIATKK